MSAPLKFFSNPACPFAHRAWLAFESKGIPYEFVEVDIVAGSKEAFFTEIYHKALGHDASSDGKVPVIVDEGTALTESSPIVEYLDTKFTGSKKLIPSDALALFKHRIFADAVSNKISSAYHGVLLGKGPTVTDLVTALESLDTLIDGPYIAGEEWGLGEVLSFPFLCSDRLEIVGLKPEMIKSDKVRTLITKLHEIPAFKKTLIGADAMLIRAKDVFSRRGMPLAGF